MASAPISLFLLSVFPFLLSAAAISDVRRFIIPNWISVGLVLTFFVFAPFSGIGVFGVLEHVAIGFAALVIGYILFELGLWGGGDGKLLGATALWFSGSSILEFGVAMALFGGAIALLAVVNIIFHSRVGQIYGIDHPMLEKWRKQTPYGVAIAGAGLYVFPSTEIFRGLVLPGVA